MKKIESLFDVKMISDREVACRLDTSEPLRNPLGMYILDERGEPVPEPDTLKWAEWTETSFRNGARRLAQDTIGPYLVSTVFMGIDHGFGEGPPVLWETMIFGMEEEIEFLGKRRRCRKDAGAYRYTSKAEALAGHASAVKLAESLPRPIPSDP